MKRFMLEEPLRHFGKEEPESRMMRKYPVRFGKRIAEKGHEEHLWYLAGTLLHSERARRQQCLPATRRSLSVRLNCRVGTRRIAI